MFNTLKSILEVVHEMEKELGLTIGFFEKLLKEDDWSFIIKLNALIETAVVFLLVKAIGGKDELKEIFSLLELNNKQTGKVAFLKKMKLLNKESRRFISTLSGIRNKFVHNIKNLDNTLKNYVVNLDKNKKNEFIKGVSLIKKSDIETDETNSYEQFIEDYPKMAIWLSSMQLISYIYFERQYFKQKTNFVNNVINMIEKLAEMRPPTSSPTTYDRIIKLLENQDQKE